jgi:GntR family transcriptional regulator of abcA and norABC
MLTKATKVNVENLNWQPDKSSSVPMYKQIIDFIKNKIASGEWSIGSRLPTQMELAAAFGVNRSTILLVYDELKADGLVESRKSSGTIIVNNAWSLLTEGSPADWKGYIEGGLQKPNLNVIKIINELDFDSKLIRLGAGELSPELYPKEYLKDVFGDISDNMDYMGYEEEKGLIQLREEICKYVKTFGIDAQPDKVLIVSGALQALHLIAIGILNQGSAVLAESPSYLNSLTLFDSHDINLSGVALDREGIVLDDIRRKCARKKADLLYTIPCFQNPTGIVMSERRRRDLLELCGNERLPIIEDDVYRELWFDDQPPVPLKANDRNGSVLYLGSISKSLSAGLRIGWIIASENVINRLADIKMQMDYGTSSVSQWMCYEFFSKGYYKGFTDHLRDELKKRRDFALSLMKELFNGMGTWNKPSGGFYIWFTLNKEVPLYRLFEACYKEGVVINPGNIYEPSNNRSIRISYAYASLEELDKGLTLLAKTIRQFTIE